MRVAHLSDLHITRGAQLEDQRDTLRAIVDAILAAGVDLVLIAGDLYGHAVPHSSHPAERDVLLHELVRLAGRDGGGCPVVIVQGNHDSNPDIDGLACAGGQWPIRVVTGAEVLEVETPSGRAHVYGLAYPTKRAMLGTETDVGLGEAQQAIQERLGQLLTLWAHRIRRRRMAAPDEPHIGLMHLQVAGAKTSGGEVLAGQEIELSRAQLDVVPFDYVALGHLHMRQEVAIRAFYPSSPWRNDYSETDPKGWHFVEINEGLRFGIPGHLAHHDSPFIRYDAEPGERLAVQVEHRRSPCRDFRTLDFRWAADTDTGIARWITRPTDEAIAACAGAEVRMRLVVPEQHVGGCPWDVEVAAVRDLAVRLKIERTIEPVLRMRAPAVAEASTDREKLAAYWGTLATQPDATEQASALEVLSLLDEHDDVALGVVLSSLGVP